MYPHYNDCLWNFFGQYLLLPVQFSISHFLRLTHIRAPDCDDIQSSVLLRTAPLSALVASNEYAFSALLTLRVRDWWLPADGMLFEAP